MSVLQLVYAYVNEQFLGGILALDNVFISDNADIISAVVVFIFLGLVLALAIWAVVAVARFFGHLFRP